MKPRHYDLKGITWNHIRGYGPLDASINLFQEQTGVRIKWDRRSLKDFGDTSLARLAREYDLIIMDHPHTGKAASSQCLIPLDDILPGNTLHELSVNSVGPSYESYYYNQHQWALPIDAACQVASYRNDLLIDPLPKNWTGVMRLARKLKSRGQSLGMALCATDCLCSFLTLCAQRGDMPAENRDVLVSEKTAYYALTLLRELLRVCHPDSLSWNPIELYNHMVSKNDVIYCPLAFGYVNYSKAYNLQYGSIPGRPGALLGGAGIAISKHCGNISMAAQYAAWLCAEKFQSGVYMEAGGQPAHKKAWLNETANEITGHFFSNTLSTIEKAYVRPRTPSWPVFQEKLGEIIHLYLRNDMEIKSTWREIEECYTFYLRSAC